MTLALIALHAGCWAVLLGNLWYLHRSGDGAEDAPGRNAHSTRRLSILIPARNEAANLRRLLPSLLAQNYSAFEVIVYDDGSSDGTGEVVRGFQSKFREKEGATLTLLRGEGPPDGWLGKTHALFQAAREAIGTAYLFLDADARLEGPGALRRLAGRFQALPEASVLTGFPRLRGGGLLLVSIVPNAILTGLPWPLVRPTASQVPSLGALNGQCWMIAKNAYHRHEPHRACKDKVLEDVEIGRLLKSRGLPPALRDVRSEVSIFMYESYAGAWRGFRKNAYLLMGGTPLRAALFTLLFLLIFVLSPLFQPWLLLSVYGLKAATDWRAGLPWWISLLAPLSFALAVALQIDSTVSHRRGRVRWKGRAVGSAKG